MTEAVYFDGLSSRAHAVSLSVDDGHLRIRGDITRDEPLSGLRWGERLGSAPRRVELGDGAYCELGDHAAFERLQAEAGLTTSWVDRAQRSWGLSAAALTLVLLLAFSGWKWGLPAAAGVVAGWMPAPLVEELSTQTLARLDRRMLRPSGLPEAEQQRLLAQFAVLSRGQRSQLLFRSGDIGPNAFALPDGRVILLDDLVRLAASEDEVLAVLAHELGHVRERHGLRALIQGSVVAGLAGAVLGDISALLAAAPAVLLQARYSRDLEREADAHAAAALIASGRSPHALADILERMQKVSGHDASALLSTHPATHERISSLRERAGPGSAP